jgi:hypothetical protein
LSSSEASPAQGTTAVNGEREPERSDPFDNGATGTAGSTAPAQSPGAGGVTPPQARPEAGRGGEPSTSDPQSPADASAEPTAEEPNATRDAGASDPDPPSDVDPTPQPDAAVPADAAAPPPAPGTPFSVCSTNTDCAAGSICTTSLGSLPGSSGAPGYCATYCDYSTGVGSCPQPANGLVKAACSLGGSVCLLGSCERSVCPDHMRCIDSETPLGAGQVVHLFACQP